MFRAAYMRGGHTSHVRQTFCNMHNRFSYNANKHTNQDNNNIGPLTKTATTAISHINLDVDISHWLLVAQDVW